MNGRELMWNTLSGMRTGRVPVSPFIFSNIVNEYNGGEPQDPIAAGIALYKRFGFDILLRNYIISDYMDESYISCANWHVLKQVERKGHDWDEKTVITTPERQLFQTKSFRRISRFEVVEAVTEYYIKEPEDFEQFIKYQPSLPQYDCSIITRAKTLIGQDGLTGPWVQGAFNMAGMYRELSELLTDPYMDEAFYAKMMEYFGERVTGFMKQAICAGADFISMSGNMASGSMAGPKMFSEYVLPYEKRVIDAVHKEGAKIIYHNCGDARQLLPLYAQMEIDMYESLTAAPYGDTVLEEALRIIPLPTALSGGIDQIDFLKTASPNEVRRRVKQVLELAKQRSSFVLAASDYICEGTPEENLIALARAGLEFGAY
jgi:hypothetical protein